jgi:hypothetical protein
MSEARLLGSAADLKFLQRGPQLHVRNFKSKGGTAIYLLASATLIPKFA